MMTNNEFLNAVKESFIAYLNKGSSRSTAKLKSIHGHVAADLQEKFGADFTIHAQGYGDDKESKIDGRYYQKNVDITISKNNRAVAGYSIKFVVRNYSQNSVNYFENMLGETANIRSQSIPYFQIFVIFDKVPYYENKGKFKKYDVVTSHNLDKYLALSKDNPTLFYHTPDKTLIVLIKLKEKSPNYRFTNDKEYANYYKSVIGDEDLFSYAMPLNADDPFEDGVIFNDYIDFIERTYHIVLGKLKN